MHRALRIATNLLVLALAIWQIVDVALAVRHRIGANFDLEWMEGATLITGMRARDGLPFYTEPTADYVPFLYPPLYAWLLGALAHVFPLGYTLGRSISVVCTSIATALLAVGARREGARWPIAIGAAALFVGCYEEGGTFYDLVRIDGLALALAAGALVLGRGESRASGVASGIMLATAFAAKHNFALLGLPIAVWRWRTLGWRDAAMFAAASAGPALAFVVGMQIHTHGLFLTYLLEVPAHHGSVWTRALPNVKDGRIEGAQAELFRALPYVTTVAVATVWAWARSRGGAYWAGVAGVALVMVSVMRGHEGGYLNVLIPMFWVLALLPVLVEGAVLPRVAESVRPWVSHLFALLLAAQLWEGRGRLDRFLPTDADARAAAQLVDELRTLPGPVLMPHGPWYPVLAGKEPSFALIALWDVDHEGGPLEKASRVIDRAIRDGHWQSVVLPDDKLGHGLKDHYRKLRPLKAKPFGTRTGWGVRFRSVWVPATSGELPADGVEPLRSTVAPAEDDAGADGPGGGEPDGAPGG